MLRFLIPQLLVLCTFKVQAALIADVETTLGTIEVELLYDIAPQATANFIKLSQGDQPRIDASTGNIVTSPLYIGEKFFRVVNDSNFKIAQTGSGTGTNIGGPGYNFKDEFNSSVRHTPYVLSMANSGPNSNGSQIFFTGNTAIPNLDDVHTIFGRIVAPASQAVIDQIMTAGSDGSSITGITIRRTDPAAVAFDENAQNLPRIVAAAGRVRFNDELNFIPDQAFQQGEELSIYRSSDLTSWTFQQPTQTSFVGNGDDPRSSIPLPVTESSNSEYYRLAKIIDPGAFAPSNLVNRLVTLPLTGGTLTYQFDATGTGGTTTFTPNMGDAITGTFTLLPDFTRNSLHALRFVADTPELTPRFILVEMACDSETTDRINCRFDAESYNGTQFVPFGTGAGTISRND